MVKHIVLWRLRADVNKEEAAAEMKRRLEALIGQIDGLLSLHVGRALAEGHYDVALVSEHTDRAALALYAGHPEHAKVKQYVHSVIEARESVDFEP